MNKHSGFTLIEVLVAMAILALSVSALIKQSGSGLIHSKVVEDKVIASFIAETELNKLLTEARFDTLQSSRQETSYQDRNWTVDITVSSTARPDMRRIEVVVAPEDSKLGPAGSARIMAFKGQH